MSDTTYKNNSVQNFDRSKIDLIKETVCKGASDNELELFLHACTRTGLDPLMRQIFSVTRGKTRTIQTGIDGYRLIADRTGKYAPGGSPVFTYKENTKKLCIESCEVSVKKLTRDGTWHTVTATARWGEYVQILNGEPTTFWANKGHIMLAKCAEALALRKAFPAELSGIYTVEEMQQNMEPEEVSGTVQKKEEVQFKEERISVTEAHILTKLIGDDSELLQAIFESYEINSLLKLKKSDFFECKARVDKFKLLREKKEETGGLY